MTFSDNTLNMTDIQSFVNSKIQIVYKRTYYGPHNNFIPQTKLLPLSVVATNKIIWIQLPITLKGFCQVLAFLHGICPDLWK